MCPDITSRQHRLVSAFKSAARREEDLALLDGWHLLHDAFAVGLDITTVAVSDASLTEPDRMLLKRIARTADVVTVTPAVMNALSPARTPAGVVALARPREVTISDTIAPAPALAVVAVNVQDPGNAGAIVRSAEAGGGTGVIFTGVSADPWGWKALRAAMGSTFRLPVHRASDAIVALAELRRLGLSLIATDPRAPRVMHEAMFDRPLAFIVGGEGAGLDHSIVAFADERVSIPMRGTVESLNVAVASALLVYEASRQRGSRGS